LKILIATNTFLPNKDGVAEAASACATAFLEKGWHVDVATEPVNPLRDQQEWNGACIHEFSISGSTRSRDPFQGETEKYRSFLLSGQWDVIIFQSYAWPLHLAVPLLSDLKSKKILVSHGYGALVWTPVRRFPFGLASLASSALLSLKMLVWVKKIDRLVFLTKRRDFLSFYDHTLARLVRHPGIRIIPNGVEVHALYSGRRKFRDKIDVSPEEILFLCVANYSLRKDQGFAVRAFRQAAIPNATLVFIGSEFNEWSGKFQLEDHLSAKSGSMGKIIWLEKQDRDTTLSAFAECDLFVLSASHEAQPIALLESMREKKPWIARDAGCIPEMPGGICVRSEKEMAAAMVKLSSERDAREKLANAGRHAIEKRYNRESYNLSNIRLIEEVIP
jgi:glycosyltransferase involved in cell wall biosynthesis